MDAMSPVFVEAQKSLATHKKCTKALSKLRSKMDEAAFRAELIKATNCALLVYKREPAVERLVQFLVAFVTSVACEAKDTGEPVDSDELLPHFVRASPARGARGHPHASGMRPARTLTSAPHCRSRPPPLRARAVRSSATS